MDSPLATASMGAVAVRSAAKDGVVSISPSSSTTEVALVGVITGRHTLPEGDEARGGAAGAPEAPRRPPAGVDRPPTPEGEEARGGVVAGPPAAAASPLSSESDDGRGGETTVEAAGSTPREGVDRRPAADGDERGVRSFHHPTFGRACITGTVSRLIGWGAAGDAPGSGSSAGPSSAAAARARSSASTAGAGMPGLVLNGSTTGAGARIAARSTFVGLSWPSSGPSKTAGGGAEAGPRWEGGVAMRTPELELAADPTPLREPAVPLPSPPGCASRTLATS